MIWLPLRRGLFVGVLAGLLSGLFAYVVGEPLVQDAINIEDGAATARAGLTFVTAHISDVEVTRPAQRGGLFLGTALYGLAMGAIFATTFIAMRGRGRPRSDLHLALLIAGAAFFVLVVLPFLKYPANPPAIGDPDTITRRTVLYLTLLAGGLMAVIAAARVGRAAEARSGGRAEPWRRPLVTGATLVALAALLVLALPGVDEVPPGFPASLLWEFRLSSLGTQAVFWAVLGIGYGIAADRAHRSPGPSPAAG